MVTMPFRPVRRFSFHLYCGSWMCDYTMIISNKWNRLILNVHNINRKRATMIRVLFETAIFDWNDLKQCTNATHTTIDHYQNQNLKSRRCLASSQNNILFLFTFVCIVCDRLHFNLMRSILLFSCFCFNVFLFVLILFRGNGIS